MNIKAFNNIEVKDVKVTGSDDPGAVEMTLMARRSFTCQKFGHDWVDCMSSDNDTVKRSDLTCSICGAVRVMHAVAWSGK